MNIAQIPPRILERIVDSPAWVFLLLKITVVLLAAWLIHAALARTNPRWRMFLWRVTAVGLVALLMAVRVPHVLEIKVKQPVPLAQTADILPESANSPAVLGTAWPDEHARFDDLAVPPPRSLPAAEHRLPDRVEPSTLAASQENAASSHASIIFPSSAIALGVWLGGIGILVFRLYFGHYRVQRLLSVAIQPPPWVGEECIRVARAIGCRTNVIVRQSS
jgi:hypothetical protein